MSASFREGLVRFPDGHHRFVQRFGSGSRRVVLQHGGPGASGTTFDPLASRLADEDLEVVVYDQLGGGRSDRPDDDSLWTVETFVEEFRALVDVLGGEPVHLLGQSWGGMLALECALAHAELVEALVLCDTIPSMAAAIEGYREFLPAYPGGSESAAALGHGIEPSPLADDVVRDLYATHVRRSYPFDLAVSRKEFERDVLPIFQDLGRSYEVMWGVHEFSPTGVLHDWSVEDRLSEIPHRTLVVCGLYDELTVGCHRRLVDGLTDARWIILGNSSHMIFHEREADIATTVIKEFLR